MRYILHPHRRTERIDASPTFWRTTKWLWIQHCQIVFDSSLKHNANILDFDPRTDSREQQTTRFRCGAAT
jgi:hypothetical protein